MKKLFLYLLIVGCVFFPATTFAAIYFCDCSGSSLSEVERVNGQKCASFGAAAEVEAVCPEGCTSGGPVEALPESCNEEVPGVAPSSTVSAPTDSGNVVKLSNPLEGNVTDVNAIIGNAIKTATGIMGALVLLMIVYGGITWLTAAGSPEKIKSGSNMIIWAILGAVVVLSSYLLLTAVLKGLSG